MDKSTYSVDRITGTLSFRNEWRYVGCSRVPIYLKAIESEQHHLWDQDAQLFL